MATGRVILLRVGFAMAARVAFGVATGRVLLLRVGLTRAGLGSCSSLTVRVAFGVAAGRVILLRVVLTRAGVTRGVSTGIDVASSWFSLAERRVAGVVTSGATASCACILACVS